MSTAYAGRPRRHLTDEDIPTIELIRTTSLAVAEATETLDRARVARWQAISQGFELGIHQLDIMVAAGVERRTVRDWQVRWQEEKSLLTRHDALCDSPGNQTRRGEGAESRRIC